MITPLSFIAELWKEWRKDGVTRHSAAIAYYTIFSLPALLLAVLSLAGAVLDETIVTQDVFQRITQLVGAETAEFIRTSLENIQAARSVGTVAGTIGIILLIGAATGIIRELQRTLNTILNISPKGISISGNIIGFILSFLLLILTAFILIVSILTGSIVAALGEKLLALTGWSIDVFAFVHSTLSYALLTALFFLLYLSLPARRFPAFYVLIGSVVASTLIVIGTVIMSYYIAIAGLGRVYGVAASLLIVLFWTYYSANVFLLGAEVIDVSSRMNGFTPQKRGRFWLNIFDKKKKK